MTALIDQATTLRSLAQQERVGRRRANVIAITSGKGGVGKSNVAVNLAIALSAAGKRVVLLDADLGLANADVLCGVVLPSNLSHVIARKKDVRDVMVEAPGGFRLIGGASGLARMADLSDVERRRIVDALAELEESADVILVDTGAGISPNVLSFTRAADHVLVLTTPEPTAITGAYAVIKATSGGGPGAAPAGSRGIATTEDARGQISLLVNQVRSPGEARVVHERIAKVAWQFLGVVVREAGYLYTDEQVPIAVRKRTPFVLASPRCPASQCVARLAMRLEQGVAAGELPHEAGFFQRMSRWFRR